MHPFDEMYESLASTQADPQAYAGSAIRGHYHGYADWLAGQSPDVMRARREEAEAYFEKQRATAAASAADFERTLAERREKATAEFTGQMQAAVGARIVQHMVEKGTDNIRPELVEMITGQAPKAE